MPARSLRDSASLLFTVAACLLIVLYPVFDYDLYWHLAFGREIARLGENVTQEMFSYTEAGRHFDNRYWLAQWLFYRLWDWAGGAGLLGLKLLVTALVAALLFFTSRNMGADPASAGVVTALAVLAGFYRFIERPELFSLLLFALLGFVLLSHAARRLRSAWLMLIPAIMLVWDWVHGGVYGLAFLIAFVTAENVRHRVTSHPDRGAIRALNWTTVVTLVAMALNPGGLLTYGVFADHLAQTPPVNPNMEYLPASWAEFKPFYFMLAWAAVLAALRPGRIGHRFGHALIVFALAILAWRISRMTGIFALACAPFIAGLLASRHGDPAWKRRVAAASTALAALFVVIYGGWVKFGETSPKSLGWHVDDQYLPAGAVRFIKATGLDGRLYNTGHIGGYLAFELYPARRIFQYNHGQIYGDTARFADNPAEFARWNISYAIVASPQELQVLFPNREWARIYRDPGSVLVVRRQPEYAEPIERYELRHFHPMMSEAAFRALARNPNARPKLVHETAVYLAHRRDPNIAQRLAETVKEHPEAAREAEISQLLRSASRHHDDVPAFRALSGALAAESL